MVVGMNGPETTEIVITEGLPEDLLPIRAGRGRAAVITQPGATRVAVEVARRLEEHGLEAEIIGVPDRDQAKTLEVAESVYRSLAGMGFGRDDTVVGVGGGSVTDLAGFVAGTWMRGVEVVHVPTTLLAAVDASVGGKTGVNLAGKNLVGLFWHPTRVVVDVRVLKSLPNAMVREGLVEALKTGLVGDPGLFQLIEMHGTSSDLKTVIERSLAVKTALVGRDEREKAERAHLNFGHTIGHAIEYASTLSHGDSVGLGLIAAAAISRSKVGFPESARVKAAVTALGVPGDIDGLERKRVTELVSMDKKRDATGARMVLLSQIGQPLVTHVSPHDLDIGLTAVGL